MYCVAYKFVLLSPNSETRRQFFEIWSAFTKYFRDECGALGSRLHMGEDSHFYAYAQWPSQEVMQAADDIVPSAEFTKLRVKWAELCAPSEILWQGEVIEDLLVR